MKWIKAARGVRYREHPERKHGLKPDRYYTIYFRRDGKQIGEKIGWASEGWTLEKVIQELNQLKANYQTGAGPVTLLEKRELEQVRKETERIQAEQVDKESMTFSSLFEIYLKQQQADAKKSWREERRLFKNWINPVIGNIRLLDIAPIHLERIKSNMGKKGLSARSIHYALAVCRQVFNYGKKQNCFHGDNPVCKVKKPTSDNRRMRFLSHAEAQQLLDELRAHSVLTYRITLISLHCGLRFGEIAALTWQDLNFQDGTILIRNPKNGQTRVAFMTEAIKAMFLEMEPGKAGDYVFQNRGKNEKMSQIPDSYMRAVNKLELNKDIIDPRLKVCFHSCRHSFASWLVAGGTDLFTVGKLLGHQTVQMTARYSHLSPDTLRKAVRSMESAIQQDKNKVIHLANHTG